MKRSGKVLKSSGNRTSSLVDLSNAELKELLQRAMVRFENWKLQMETNPNPRMVHNLKSIVSIIETITNISEMKMRYSYKELSRQMALLLDSVARLNLLISESLQDDDLLDESEEQNINSQMMDVIHRVVELIRLAQTAFASRRRLAGPQALNLKQIDEVTRDQRSED